MSKTYFTNRHGKKLRVDTEDQRPSAQTGENSIQAEGTRYLDTTPPIAQRRRTLTALLGRKRRIGIVIGLTLLVIIAVGVVVIIADGARREYDRQAATLQTLVRTVAATPSSTETSARDAIEGVLRQLDSPDSCRVHQPQQLIDLYPPAREAAARCHDVFTRHQAVKDRLQTMQQTVIYLELQNTAVAPALARPADDAFAQIDVMYAAWGEAQKALEDIDTPDSARTQHEALVGRVRQITEQWAALSAANGAQQREAFVAAETALAKAYEALRASQDDFRLLLDSQQAAITEAVALSSS